VFARSSQRSLRSSSGRSYSWASISTSAASATALAAAAALLLWRLWKDVGAKPLFEDEAVAGLVAARPVHELLGTVMWDRGGAPLHFLLAHAGFALSGGWETLRWLSVAAALASVPVSYDLGRRLAGPPSGAVAALVVAASTVLSIYGSFGRMYALLVLAGAVAADLFVRALQLRTPSAAALAAGGAWLLPAVHPYGAIPVAAGALVALWLWRGRPFRAGAPALLVGLAAIPFAVADLRLSGRFGVGVSGDSTLASPTEAWKQFGRAIESFSGGGVPLLVAAFCAVALAGAAVLVHERNPFVVVAAASLLAPPLLFMLVRSAGSPGLSPRHLAYALPVWAALIGVGITRLAGRHVWPAVAVAGAAAALATPGGIVDPRATTSNAILGGGPGGVAPGSPRSVAPAAGWARSTLRRGDVLFPYSPAFLAALPEAGRALSLPYGQAPLLRRTLRRADWPVPGVVIAVPLVDGVVGGRWSASRSSAYSSSDWFLVRVAGPFADERELLGAASDAFASVDRSAVRRDFHLDAYLERNRRVLREALDSAGS
jgi:Dolichyl-phosphate-mannose-protein mannosyltransferase